MNSQAKMLLQTGEKEKQSSFLLFQVANVFQSLTDNAMQPCIVHRESKLLINPRHPIILATPNALFNYRLSSLTNVQVVVTDEADLILNGKGDEVWEILSFFKGVDSLKTKKRQRRLARRQKASRQHNAIQESESPSESTEKTRINVTNVTFDLEGECNQPSMATAAAPNRQFVFVAATLPQHGPKSVFNVLKKWIPDAEFVSTGLAHHTVPTVGISYLSVREADKLPELLRCLNVLVGIIDYPLTREENSLNSDEVDFGSKENVGSDSNISSTVNVNSLDSNKAQKEIKAHRERTREPSHEPVSLTNLRVLVFANSTKAAERAFNFLSDIKETGESDSLPWKHVTKNDVTVTTWPVEQDDDGSDGENASSFLTHTGNKDIWIGRVGMIHKRLPLSERIETLNKFKSGVLKVLICTDLASRGLDIQDVSHVIQLDFAPNAAAVLHRTGRTARAGASGKGKETCVTGIREGRGALKRWHSSVADSGLRERWKPRSME